MVSRRLRQLRQHTRPAAGHQPKHEAVVDAPFHATRPELGTPADPDSQFARVMVVIAHPDDESMAGGTIAKMAALGKAVRIVVLTNGDKGSGDFEMTSERLAKLRAAEMHAAAEVNLQTLLGFPLKMLENMQFNLSVSLSIFLLYLSLSLFHLLGNSAIFGKTRCSGRTPCCCTITQAICRHL